MLRGDSMNFIIINDIRQKLPDHLHNGPWIHHATIKRGLKEYIVFRNQASGKIYLEEVEQHRATLVLQEIKDDQEWKDLYHFARNAGLLAATGPEIKVANVTNS